MKEMTAKQLRNEVVNKLWTYGNLPENIQTFMGDEVAFMLEIIDTKVKEQLRIGGVSHLLIAWEQYKKANWWESDAVDVEKVLIEQFEAIYCG